MAAACRTRSCRRSPTPAGRATSKGATSICRRRNTWRRTRGASSPPACSWWAAAAARRRSTSATSSSRRARSRRRARGEARAREARGRGRCGADAGRGARRSSAAGQVAPGERAGARAVRRHASSSRRRAAMRATTLIEQARAAEDSRRRRRCTIPDQAGSGAPHERAGDGRAGRAAGRHRDRAPATRAATHLLGDAVAICSARTRWASAICCSSPAIRRSAANIPTRPSVLRSRFDRLDQRRHAPQPGHRHRRPGHRQADGVSHRRDGAIPASLTLDEEIRRFQYKVEAGAEFAVTAPVFDVADLELFLEAHRRRAHADRRRLCVRSRACCRPSSWPTKCPDIRVPDALVERMRRAEQRGARSTKGSPSRASWSRRCDRWPTACKSFRRWAAPDARTGPAGRVIGRDMAIGNCCDVMCICDLTF